MSGKRVIITGATGMVGGLALWESLRRPTGAHQTAVLDNRDIRALAEEQR